MREGRPPGVAGDRQGARPKRAMGQETSTQVTCVTCVHAGRRVPQGRSTAGKGGGEKKKKPQSTAAGRKAQSEQAAGEREGAKCAEEGPRVARKKKSRS